MSFIVPFGIAFLAISMIAIGIILIIRNRGVGKNSPPELHHSSERKRPCLNWRFIDSSWGNDIGIIIGRHVVETVTPIEFPERGFATTWRIILNNQKTGI